MAERTGRRGDRALWPKARPVLMLAERPQGGASPVQTPAYAVRASARPNSSTIALRITNFCGLPEMVIGSSSRNRT